MLVRIYSIIPKNVKNYLGKLSYLRFFRDIFLRQHKTYREVSHVIERIYGKYAIKFIFYGSVKDVSKALKRGIESKLLLNSIKLHEDFINSSQEIVVFDIGANFGYLSLVWAQTICKKGKIYAFEPNPNVFKSFQKSIIKNELDDKITLESNAFGVENKQVNLYIDGSTSNIDKDSITLNKSNVINETVNMMTIDTYLEKNKIGCCDIIKIDVDGIELDILKGCVVTINKFKPIFIVETNMDLRIIEFFYHQNYKVLDMDLNEYQPNETLPLNVFCIPK
jgi:FkbM family methyltransferase